MKPMELECMGRPDTSPKSEIKELAEKILNPEISYSPDIVYSQMRIIQQNVDCAKRILELLRVL